MIAKKIRQRLLENQDLTVASTAEKARILELAQNAQSFNFEYLQQTLAKPHCSETSTAPESFDNNLKSFSQMQNNDYTASECKITIIQPAEASFRLISTAVILKPTRNYVKIFIAKVKPDF